MGSEATPKDPQRRPGVTRRRVLQGMGATALAAVAGSRRLGGLLPGGAPRAAAQGALPGLPRRPNILLLITDQERNPQWWPAGWADNNLPNRKRLVDKGLSFERAFCSAAMCTPSRATLFTGQYPVQHGMVNTLSEGGSYSPCEPTLRQDVLNMGQMLRSAGYDVQYRGKWHLSKGPDGGDSTSQQLADYGFDGWEPPEAAQDTLPEHYGGGCANRDAPYAQQAADWLLNEAPEEDRPFLLVASFGNPHDVLAYPENWDAETEPGCFNYLPAAPGLFQQGIEVPPTFDEDLLNNFKPTVQGQLKLALSQLGLVYTEERARNYANFYAYLHTVVDAHIGQVLDALEADQELHRNTIVIRISDHGEMGMSHGGLRQKAFVAYEEALNVPLIVSNPVLFPGPVTTDAFATLIDLMPTLASLAGVEASQTIPFPGRDLSPILRDAVLNPGSPSASVQDHVYFTFDDENASDSDELRFPTQPKNIRCIRTERYKYAYYFDPLRDKTPERELYDLQVDPQELNNLAHPDNPDFDPALTATMHSLLLDKMIETGTRTDRGSIQLRGSYDSPPGALPAQPRVAGLATFDIEVENPQETRAPGIPRGHVSFEIDEAGLAFESRILRALWVAGTTARCTGEGRLNGEGRFGFELWIRTAGTFGADSPDVLRVQIYDATKRSTEDDAIVYDTELGEGMDCGGQSLDLSDGTLEILPAILQPGDAPPSQTRIYLPFSTRNY